MIRNFTYSLFIYRRLLLALVLLDGFLFSNAQTTITQWNFNSAFTIPANGNAPAPSVGGGTIALIGGVTGGDAAGVSSDPGTPNNGLNTTAYPVQGTNPKTAGIAINVNTSGFNNLRLKFYVRHSGSAAKKIVVQYFDGTIWQDIFTYLGSSTNFSAEQSIDLSTYTVLNNNTTARLRLVTDYSSGNTYEGATGVYGASGTIRYDLITITGNSTTCIGPATQQAAGLRLLKTDINSAQLTLNRGNGGGCLVVCSSSGIPTAPINNTIYNANASFGSGAVLGNSFAVYNTQVSNPAVQYFNITSLAAGTKYYVAAYEYSTSGNCYLTPAFVDSFYCNSTVLYPGDVQFIGYDNNDSLGGRDFFVLTNLATLKKGTTFQIVNSRFEAGAVANERTNRWFAGGNDIHQNLQRITITYTGNSLAAGSIISFNHLPQNAVNIKINGSSSTELIITDNLTIGNLLSGSGAEQFFITQGRFTTYGASGVNQYSILNGYVLHGISYTNNWVSFNANPSAGTNNADRESRIPADIEGFHLYFPISGYAYYNPGSLHAGTQNLLLSTINNSSVNWSSGADANTNQINAAVLTTPFSPNRLTAAGTWAGNANDNNWFNAVNWEGLFVPDSFIDVNIPTGKISLINAVAPFADLYNRVAMTQALTITGSVNIHGPASDKLIVYDSLLVETTGSFSALNGIDTIILRGNLQRRDGSDIGAFANSFFSLSGNRILRPIDIWLITGTIYNVRTFSINNAPGVQLLNGGIETVQQLELTNGILSVIDGSAVYNLRQNCIIRSPLNVYGENDRGWEKSFIDGRVNIGTNNMTASLTAPVGSASKKVFAPIVFITNSDPNANNRIYSAKYTAASHSRVDSVDIANPPLNRVSKLEYWNLNSNSANAAAKITLYYTPYSQVGRAGDNTQALLDLRVAQYWDSISGGGVRKWRLPGSGAHLTTGDSNYGKIVYNEFATDLRFGSDSFTLGSISRLNALPVQLITWKAAPQSKRVQLTWQVANETDVANYIIEKSTDGVHYTSLLSTKRAVSLNELYTNHDQKPVDGWNYYRLKATGIDGKNFYSVIQKVWYTSAGQWLVYPNPATDVLWLQLPAAGTVTLYTIDGKMVMQRRLPASLSRLPLQQLAEGVYMLEYFDGRKKQSQKISLQ